MAGFGLMVAGIAAAPADQLRRKAILVIAADILWVAASSICAAARSARMYRRSMPSSLLDAWSQGMLRVARAYLGSGKLQRQSLAGFLPLSQSLTPRFIIVMAGCTARLCRQLSAGGAQMNMNAQRSMSQKVRYTIGNIIFGLFRVALLALPRPHRTRYPPSRLPNCLDSPNQTAMRSRRYGKANSLGQLAVVLVLSVGAVS